MFHKTHASAFLLSLLLICSPIAAKAAFNCEDGLLHLSTGGQKETIYRIGTDGTSTFINEYPGDFRQNLAVDPQGVAYTIQKLGQKRVLTRLNDNNTKTCNPDCSVDTGIPGSIEAMGFGFDGALFAVDVANEVVYTVSTVTGLASVYYNLKAVSGANAADGIFGIDFQGGDLVITADNQMIYVRYTDGAVFRVDLNFPTNRAFLGNLPNDGKNYTSLAQLGSTFYALEPNGDKLQPFTVSGNSLALLPAIGSADIGTGDAASCPQAPVGECAQDNLIKNGDFESVNANEGMVHFVHLNELGTGGKSTWDVYSLLPDVTDGAFYAWYASAGSGIEVQKNTIVAAHSGSHYVELDSHPTAQRGNTTNSTVTQLVGLNGGDYDLSFWYRARTVNANDNKLEVLVDGNVVYTVNSTDTTQWVRHEVSLKDLPLGYYEISFRGAGTQNQLGAFLDDVALACDQVIVTPVCGNEILESGEACDDGNQIPLDGCSQSCQIEYFPPVCGNEVVEEGEQCDDGANVNGDGCSAECTVETPSQECGNEVLESPEQCDDGNSVNGDGCSNDCTLEIAEPVCGNETLEEGEQCDDGNTNDNDGCSETCMIEDSQPQPECGNEVVESGEQCDDGANVNGDGCSAACQIETPNEEPVPECGNEVVEEGEQCDDGAAVDGDGCSATCQTELDETACGNGVLEIGELCDDGNTSAGDGCDAQCVTEPTNNDNPDTPDSNDLPVDAGGDQPGSDCESGSCEADDTGDADPQIAPAGGAGAGNQVQGSGASCSLNENQGPKGITAYLGLALGFIGIGALRRKKAS